MNEKATTHPLRYYTWALALTAAVFVFVLTKSGFAALWPVFILAIIEITFSFDNAVLNSEVLGRMSRTWRLVFLTVGIAVAVFGVRLLLPLVLVSLTAGHSIGHVFGLALHNPTEYAQELHEGYPIIAAFGGVFLLMIGLRFLAEDRETKWIPWLERRIAKLNRPWLIPIAGAILAVVLISLVLRPHDIRVVVAGLFGAAVFLGLKWVSERAESNAEGGKHSNLINFLYLELLDASFSFDGVIAAFAITQDVLLIAAGLGIGAFYVRSITIHLLEKGTLNEYRYLIHGAHYAILILGMIMLFSMKHELPEWVTGLLTTGVIAWAIISSVRHNRRAAVA